MKEEIDALIAEHGQENAPPPWTTFTISNNIKEGNMHVVQKVFEGSFEVWQYSSRCSLNGLIGSLVRCYLFVQLGGSSGDV